MSTRSLAWPQGVPCWVDLATFDIPGAKALYSELFGWEMTDHGEAFGGYQTCDVGGGTAAGIGPAWEGTRPAWTVYIATDDAERTAAAITENGGRLFLGPTDVADLGRMLRAADPQGAVFGVWQAGTHIGSGVVNEPGGLLWEDATTPDLEAAQGFYSQVFGWQFEAMGPSYATFSLADGIPLGGINASVPEGHPPYWLAYFGVADTDAAIATTERHGGKALRPAWDSPYGRMAVLADASQAVFAVIQTSGEHQPDRSS